MALEFMKKISPEYVLKKAIEDMKKTGLDGLKPYLTKDALEKFKMIRVVSGGVGMFSGLGIGKSGEASGDSGDGLSSAMLLLEKLSECDWTIIDLLKGSSSAKAVLGFKYEDKLEGTVDLSMIQDNKEWKIDNVEMPKFTKS